MGKKHALRGLQPGSLSIISSHRMENILNNNSHGVITQLHFIQMQPSAVSTTPLDLQQILDRYACVFVELVEFPPSRTQHHRIPLLPGSIPPNIWPYHYLFHHKTEIEMVVQDLLKEGIILPSTSSFSSPILRVRKKYGSWCLCIEFDYLITLQSRIIFQFLLLMSFWISFMVLIFSPSWIFVLGITKFRFIRMISLKQLSTHMMDTMSFWSCHLASQILLPHSRN